MKAMLVTVSLTTRVVVAKNASDNQIIETAKERFIEKINNELLENIEAIVDDLVMPYDENIDS